MSVAYVAERGTPKTSTATTSWVFSPSANTTAGNHLVLLIGGRGGTMATVTVTDSKGNTWTTHQVTASVGPNSFSVIASCHLTSALTTSDTITVTFNVSAGPSITGLLEEFSGVASTSFQDAVGTSSDGSGTSHSCATGTNVTNAGELVVVAVGSGAPNTFTAGANYTAFATQNGTSGAASGDRQISGIYRIGPSSGGTETAAFTSAASTATYNSLVALVAAAAPAPANTVAPSVGGTQTAGQVLQVTSVGSWTNAPTGYSYQWQRADDSGFTVNVTNIGSNASTYTLTSSESGKYVRCQVTASNAGGSSSPANSNVAAQVTAAPSPTDGSAPSSPTAMDAVRSGGSVSLSWRSPADPDLNKVVVVRKNGSAPGSPADGTTVFTSTIGASNDNPPFNALDSAGNSKLNAAGRWSALRFVASQTGTLNYLWIKVRTLLADGSSYTGGTLGTADITLCTVNNDGTPDLTNGVLYHASGVDPNGTINTGNKTWKIPVNCPVVSGQMYALVIKNTDPTPATNYFSAPNNHYLANGAQGAQARNELSLSAADLYDSLKPRELLLSTDNSGSSWNMPGSAGSGGSTSKYNPVLIQDYGSVKTTSGEYYTGSTGYTAGTYIMVYQGITGPWTIDRVAVYLSSAQAGTYTVDLLVNDVQQQIATFTNPGGGVTSVALPAPVTVGSGDVVKLRFAADPSGAAGLALKQQYSDSDFDTALGHGTSYKWYGTDNTGTEISGHRVYPVWPLPYFGNTRVVHETSATDAGGEYGDFYAAFAYDVAGNVSSAAAKALPSELVSVPI